jgi:hypothetical protein
VISEIVTLENLFASFVLSEAKEPSWVNFLQSKRHAFRHPAGPRIIEYVVESCYRAAIFGSFGKLAETTTESPIEFANWLISVSCTTRMVQQMEPLPLSSEYHSRFP